MISLEKILLQKDCVTRELQLYIAIFAAQTADNSFLKKKPIAIRLTMRKYLGVFQYNAPFEDLGKMFFLGA
jgi:hypothetical protein